MVQKIISINTTSSLNEIFLEVGRNYISVFSTDTSLGEINGLEIFAIDGSLVLDITLEEIINQSSLLEIKDNAVNVVFQNPHACCIPQDLYKEEDTENYRELLNAPYAAMDYASVMNTFTVKYFVDGNILNFLKKKFTSVKVTHKYSTVLHHLSDASFEKDDYVYVVFYNQSMIVTVYKSGKFQLINSFEFTKEADVLYYFLNIFEQFQLDKSSTDLILSGEISKEGNLYNALYTYFSEIKFDEPLKNPLTIENGYEGYNLTPYLCNITYFKR